MQGAGNATSLQVVRNNAMVSDAIKIAAQVTLRLQMPLQLELIDTSVAD